MQFAIRDQSIAQIVYEYIRDHPGCKRADILAVLPEGTKPQTVSSTMNRLQRRNAIVNRGGFAQYSAWYLVEEEASPRYHAIAQDILDAMQNIHHAHRAEYLAQRLEDMFNRPQLF